MVETMDLWLPILLAAVFVFIVSSVIHMALPIHKNDYTKMNNEEAVLEAMRAQGLTPGHFAFPHCEMKDVNTPEYKEKLAKGPVGFMTILGPGGWNMGRSLVQWFVLCLVIGIFVAYLTGLALDPGAPYGDVFRISSTVAWLGYGFSQVQDSMWKGLRWSISLKYMFFDGLLYALVTGGTFGWLWPEALPA